MRALIAPNPYKHCLSAERVAAALGRGFRSAGWQVDLLPLADGGPGTLDAVQAALGGERRRARVLDPLGRPCQAIWLKVGRIAVIESAQAIGLERLGKRRAPLRASSEGLGQLLLAAQRARCREAWVGLGGSATTDGGTGLARSLGWKFLDAKGRAVAPGGGGLGQLARVIPPAERRLTLRLRAWVDVTNALTGPRGAASVFAPQKGATPAQVAVLRMGLARLARVYAPAEAVRPGAGAAGGLGYGLQAFCGATLESGAAALLKLSRFDARARRADLVVSGEGSLDAQSLRGKLPQRVMLAAQRLGVPGALVVGQFRGSAGPWQRAGARAIVSLAPLPRDIPRALAGAPRALREAGRFLAGL